MQNMIHIIIPTKNKMQTAQQNKKTATSYTSNCLLERETRLELATFALGRRRSTIKLLSRNTIIYYATNYVNNQLQNKKPQCPK